MGRRSPASATPPRAARSTRQLRAVRGALRGRTDHPSAEQVHAAVARLHSGISLATVYRNLTKLVASGEVGLLNGGGPSRFDPVVGPHDHFECRQCGRVYDLLVARLARRRRQDGHRIESERRTYGGICRSCLQKRAAVPPARPRPGRTSSSSVPHSRRKSHA